MSYKVAAEAGRSYNRPLRQQDEESADTLGTLCRDLITELKSSRNHPKSTKRSRHHRDGEGQTLGTRAMSKAPMSNDTQAQSSGWWPKFGKPNGYASLDEIDLTDWVAPSTSDHPANPPKLDGGRHSHSSAHLHAHPHSEDGGHHHAYGHPHSHEHEHEHEHDHEHPHGHEPDHDHEHHHDDQSHTHHELQSLLPEGATRFMTAMSGTIKKRVVSAFQPPEDPCAPETSLLCLLWGCVLTVAESKKEDDDHHGHSHDVQDGHSHGDNNDGHSHVHTEQYHSHPPLPKTMADWADRCPEPCLDADGSICTKHYRGKATHGHSHM
jgi:hypothetical protein